MDEEIYQEQILEAAASQKNKYIMEDCTCVGDGKNPSCGDSGKLYVKIKDEKVSESSFAGEGCAISQAGMSMMAEYIKDKTLHELNMIMPGDVYQMLGIKITPARVGCALLCYNALEEAVKKIK
jgi:nitrogen fixation NifU-like protein